MTHKAKVSILARFSIRLWWNQALLLLLASCSNQDVTPWYTYQIVNTFPHDRGAFTQGLVFDDGFLYEGTGLNGSSSVRKVGVETGEVLKLHTLPGQFFGEGLTIFQDRIIQLTWRSRTGFVYDKEMKCCRNYFIKQKGGALPMTGNV